MSEETIVTIPLVRVNLAEDDDNPEYTRIRYFVGDEQIMDMSVEKEYVPHREGIFPAMILTQLLVTPHHHLAVLGELAAICAAIDVKHIPVPQERWEQLLSNTQQLLAPPPPPEELVQG